MSDAKLIRDGKVAVIYSPGFGAGWSTWSGAGMAERMMFCPELAEAIERGASSEERRAIAERLFPDEYLGGLDKCRVEWLPKGTPFRINEYDGSESIKLAADMDWVAA
jgi:hypothetical protein